jgi:hypothetical protein
VGEGRGRSHTFGQVIGSGGEVTYDVAALDMQSALDPLHVFQEGPMSPSVAYLSADVIALTGASESYLAFLVRAGIVCPLKHRNGRTNLFPEAELERVRWAVGNRGQLSIDEMRHGVLSGAA